jgi:TonB-linked SusC/RagA family outer membrane protein
MKLTIVLLIAACMQVNAKGYAQKITLSQKNVSLAKIFREIRNQSEYLFLYNDRQMGKVNKVTIKVKDASIEQVLEECFKDQPLTYTIVDKTIVVIPKEEVNVLNTSLPPPPRIITGTVRDEKGEPLAGVSISVKGISMGTTTNEKGFFRLELTSNNVVLIISYIGYKQQEIVIGNQATIDIKLQALSNGLDEVVVIGYGTQKKKDLTGAVTSVNIKKIDELPLLSVDQILAGRVGGVQINQSSGQAGAATSIRIRGGNSLNGTNEPLFVVDGFPIINDNSVFAAPGPLGLTNVQGGSNQGNPNGVLSWLNPADIESIEVLKDASSTAIYGSRGANGVIIITTKNGKSGQGRINFSTSIGVNNLNDKNIRLMGAKDYANYSNLTRIYQGLLYQGIYPYYNDTTLNGEFYPTPDKVGNGTNWLDVIKQKGITQNFAVDFSGGGDATTYSGGVSWSNQQTPIRGSQFQRLSSHLNSRTKVTKWLNADNNIIYTQSIIDNGPNDTRDARKYGAFEAALQANPVEPVYNKDGSYNFKGGAPLGVSAPGLAYNPLAMTTDTLNRNTGNTFLDNLSLKATIVEGINFEVRGSVFHNDVLRDIYYNSKTTYNGSQVGGLAGKNSNNSNTYLIENFATVNKTFGKNVFNAVLGYSYTDATYRIMQIGTSGFPNDILKNENMGAGNTQYPTQTTRVEDLLESYYVRVNDIFNDKYILTFTARRDGSSKFGSNNKWATFPSGAFGWRLKQENFLKDVKKISELKLRISYGSIGNQAIQSLQSKSLLGLNNYPIGGVLQTGVYPSILGNPNLKWEVTNEFNVGLDFGLFDQRLTGSLNYYVKNTSDLLQQLTVPANSGFSTLFENIGSISNKGIELELHGSIINNNNFTWDISANIAHNKNKLTNLGGGSDTLIVTASYYLGQQVVLIKGRPVGLFYGYIQDGIYKSQSEVDNSAHLAGDTPGDLKFRDLNKDGIIDNRDQTVIGDPNPKFIYGFTNSFSYKKLDLNIVFQGVYGGDIYDVGKTAFNNADMLDYWSPSNPNGKYAAPGHYIGNTNQSNFYVSKGSYLKLKSVALGYNFYFSKIKSIRNIRLFASASNLLTITKYKGFDPEVNSYDQSNLFRNIADLTVPLYKTYVIGINIGL